MNPQTQMWDESHLVERFRRILKEGAYAGPQPEAEITVAEGALDVRLPQSYRVFLKHFGAARLRPPYEIAGLSPHRQTGEEPPLWSHITDETESVRRVSRGKIPESYLPISSDGGDYFFYLDTGTSDARGECPVVVLGPGLDGVLVTTSFVEFTERTAAGDPLRDLG